MPRKPIYHSEEERSAAKKQSRTQWYQRNRETQLIKMRNRYDRKVAIPQDRDRRHQAPQPTPSAHLPDARLVQRSIRRIRQLDDILRGATTSGNLRTYAADVYHDYASREPEEGFLMLIDLESDVTVQLKAIEVGQENIRKEVGIADAVWKEASAIRERYARALGYFEDMRQRAEKGQLKARFKCHQLLFQQRTD